MARALVIEEEHGTSRGHQHPHNGYYAGDFGDPSMASASPEPSALRPLTALPVHNSRKPARQQGLRAA